MSQSSVDLQQIKLMKEDFKRSYELKMEELTDTYKKCMGELKK